MWGSLLSYFRHLLTLAEATQRNTESIREIRQELKELTVQVQHLKSELRRGSENEKLEREKLVLLLENQLLRFERRLPAPKSGKSRKKES